MADFALPDLGEGVAEAEIDRWLVEEGQQIGEDDPLVEVITDKATAEIPSPFAGVVSRIHVKSGEIVPVGTVLITISDAAEATGDGSQPQDAGDGERRVTSEEAARENGVSANGGKAMPPIRRLAVGARCRSRHRHGIGAGRPHLAGGRRSGGRGRFSPRAGERGHRFRPRERGDRDWSVPSDRAGRGPREPFRGVRRKIAERMVQAHLAVPPVTHVEECDVTELDATRRLANERSPEDVHLTFLPFIIKAVIQGLKDFPALNASLDEDAGEIVLHDRYDIGIAVDTPAGLVVPVIKDADQKRLRAIVSEIERFSAAARDGTLTNVDISNGTFTVTSPGPFGGLMATPIVLYPQSAILGVHRATDRPVVRDGQIVIRKMMNMSVTFDHRILDGMTAARFILDVVKLLEHPAVLALEA